MSILRLVRLCTLLLPIALPAAAVAASQLAPVWRIDARLHAGGSALELSACSAQAMASIRFRAGRGAEAFLLSSQRDSGAPLHRRGPVLHAGNWKAGECLRLRIDLDAAARSERYGIGQRRDHYVRTAVSSWLWRPEALHRDSRLHFILPEGWQASMPWPRSGDGSFEVGAGSAWRSAIGAFGRFSELRREVAGGQLRVAVLPGVDDLDSNAIADWLAAVGSEVARQEGGFPQAQLQVLVVPLPGVDRPVPWGEVTRGGGSAVHLLIGAEASQAALREDWTAWHEFSHLLHPYLGQRGRWLTEGLASYYQNLLRARSGEFSAIEAWRRLRAGFERGISASADSSTPLELSAARRERGSTMRVYWGGAAFWLETDLRLQATGDSVSALLRRYRAGRRPLDCCASVEGFVEALDGLAPSAGIESRWREYADSRAFPLSEERLRALDRQSGDADSVLSSLFSPEAR